MKTFDEQYAALCRNILDNGVLRDNRTGEPTWAIPSAMVCVDLEDGFPLLTLKRVPFRVVAVELEGFIKGITDKRWYQERRCHIWDEWCAPMLVPYGHDEATKAKMKAEPELGPVYGHQWRDFNGITLGGVAQRPSTSPGDQLASIVRTLHADPNSRRMVCSAWNPLQSHLMALTPCHYAWQVLVIDGKLHLNWTQRST